MSASRPEELLRKRPDTDVDQLTFYELMAAEEHDAKDVGEGPRLSLVMTDPL